MLSFRDRQNDRKVVRSHDVCCWAEGLLGRSWVVISGVISRVTIIIIPIKGLVTLRITTHEPPNRVQGGMLRMLLYSPRW